MAKQLLQALWGVPQQRQIVCHTVCRRSGMALLRLCPGRAKGNFAHDPIPVRVNMISLPLERELFPMVFHCSR